MKAYVLIETSAGKTESVRKALGKVTIALYTRAKTKGCTGIIESLDAVTGRYDFIAVVVGRSMDDISQLVTEEIVVIDGISSVITCFTLFSIQIG